MTSPSMHSPLLLPIATHRATLVFGLDWSTVIGSRVRQLARRRAMSSRASHFTYCGRRGVAVGTTVLPRATGVGRYHSAAAIFARVHDQGSVVACEEVPGAGFWVVAARDGAVLSRTDRLYPIPEEAAAAVQRLAVDVPNLNRVFLCGSADKGVGVNSAEDTSASTAASTLEMSWFSDRLASDDAMRRVGPVGIGWAVAFLCAAVLIGAMWWIVGNRHDDAADTDAARQPLTSSEIDSHWQAARQQALRKVWRGGGEVAAVLLAVRTLAISSRGWRLAGAECEWYDDQWRCRAAYGRETPLATNEALLDALGQRFTVTFSPFSQARALWRVDAPRAVLQDTDLASAVWTDVVWASALQRYAPAMGRMELGQPEDLIVPIPTHPHTGEALPAVARASQMRRREVELAGPLRTFGLLPLAHDGLAWTHVAVGLDADSPVELDRSAVHVTLRGWIYEQKDND